MRSLLGLILSLVILPACNANKMKTSANQIHFNCGINAETLAQGAVVLDCVAINTSQQTIKLLPWATPLESRLRGRFLEVRNSSGEVLDYQGMMVKRAAPSVDDYLLIEAESPVKNSIDLTQSYSFSAKTSYRIDYSGQQWGTNSQEIKLWMPTVEFTTPANFGARE